MQSSSVRPYIYTQPRFLHFQILDCIRKYHWNRQGIPSLVHGLPIMQNEKLLGKLSQGLSPSPLLFLSLRKIQCSSLMWAPLSTMSWRRSASAWPTLNTRESVSQGNSDTKSTTNNKPLSPKNILCTCKKGATFFLSEAFNCKFYFQTWATFLHQKKPRNNDLPMYPTQHYTKTWVN